MNNFSEFLMNSLFEFQNYPCECKKETVYDAPGCPPHFKLKVCAKTNKEPMLFSYSPQKGLSQTGNAGKMISENILGQLLAIPVGDVDAAISFIEKYGFLFPISSEQYETVDDEAFMSIIERVRATILLMSAIAGKPDYKKMLIYTTFLLYSAPVELRLFGMRYTTEGTHAFTKLIHEYCIMPDTYRNQELFDNEYLSIKDRVINGYQKVYMDDIIGMSAGDGISGLKGSKDIHFKNLFALYTNYGIDDDILRTTIDFYYNYQRRVAVISGVVANRITYHSEPNRDNFSDEMKSALMKIARATISAEINANLRDISPQIDIDTLTPSWRLGSLLESLYFSVFYMKPGMELYKECENPNCNHEKYFLIKATVTNKKYCCPECANAAAQRRSRQRKMSK